MSEIKILDSLTINKIAAGEIIERPVSVVKELLENSIDADSKNIEIEIKDGGLSLIKITDDGHGMSNQNLKKSFLRHATSKIDNFRDLEQVKTFGFRGEALASITAISQTIITSKSSRDSLGKQIKIIDEKIISSKDIALNNGTSIEVRNLFYNLPARRKNIKSISYEAGLIKELITKYSLGHPKVNFKLINNKKISYDTKELKTTLKRIENIYGLEIAKNLKFVERTFDSGITVRAWLGSEHHSRKSRSEQTFFVNGRIIKNQLLSTILDDSYHTIIESGRFPIAILKLEIPYSEVDINIHPNKLKVKIDKINILKDDLFDLFSSSLRSKSVLLKKDNEENLPEVNIDNEIGENQINYASLLTANKREIESVQENIVFPEPFIINNTPPKINNKEILGTEKTGNIQSKDNDKIDLRDIKDLQIIGQLQNTFILAQNKKALYIIDQHTCHERILYEQNMSKEKEKEIQTENLLIPQTLKLTPKQEAVLIKNILLIDDLGFLVESFGIRTFVLRGIPIGIDKGNIEKSFFDLLETLSSGKNIDIANLKESILTMSSCKGAVKANYKLSNLEIKSLLKDLSKVENPHTCPHGRPIIHEITMKELYKIFKRGFYDEKN